MSDVLDRVREACAEVASRARSVRVEPERLEALATELEQAPAPPELDPARHHLGDPGATLAYVVTLDAVNFGSGWFPKLRKRPGLSGYFTIATSLKERFEARDRGARRICARWTPTPVALSSASRAATPASTS